MRPLTDPARLAGALALGDLTRARDSMVAVLDYATRTDNGEAVTCLLRAIEALEDCRAGLP